MLTWTWRGRDDDSKKISWCLENNNFFRKHTLSPLLHHPCPASSNSLVNFLKTFLLSWITHKSTLFTTQNSLTKLYLTPQLTHFYLMNVTVIKSQLKVRIYVLQPNQTILLNANFIISLIIIIVIGEERKSFSLLCMHASKHDYHSIHKTSNWEICNAVLKYRVPVIHAEK